MAEACFFPGRLTEGIQLERDKNLFVYVELPALEAPFNRPFGAIFEECVFVP